MIITRKKPPEALLAMLKGFRRVALVGCGSCAAACQTGGEKELGQLRQFLKPLRECGAEAIVGLACGDGVQTVADNVKIPVFPANDTLFLGQIERAGVFREACRMCGDCMLDKTAGICPVTQCAKSLVHGPCGGQRNGRCEVNPENECAWIRIFRRLQEQDRLEVLLQPREDKDYQHTAYPQLHSLRDTATRKGR